MPTTIKNLGHATAYAFAVAGGYRGTIQEFEAGLAASANYANNAEASSLVSEGFATGTQDGSNVGSQSPYYHNNAEYYAVQAQAAVEHYPRVVNRTLQIWDPAQGAYADTPITAAAEVYIGHEAPTDPNVIVWIDPTRDNNLTNASGVSF